MCVGYYLLECNLSGFRLTKICTVLFFFFFLRGIKLSMWKTERSLEKIWRFEGFYRGK